MERLSAIWDAIMRGFSSMSSWATALGVAWRWLLAGIEQIRASFMALVNSPTVIAAVVTIAFFAFVFGFGVGKAGKRGLMDRLDAAQVAEAKAVDDAAQCRVTSLSASTQMKTLQAEIDELKAKRPQNASGSSVAAKRTRPAPKAAPKPEAATAPGWNPFKW